MLYAIIETLMRRIIEKRLETFPMVSKIQFVLFYSSFDRMSSRRESFIFLKDEGKMLSEFASETIGIKMAEK